MDVVFVSPEIAPYSRWTRTGEASAALPKALRGLGHKVTVISPLWASIDPAARHLARRLVKIEVEAAGTRYPLALFDGRSTGGVDLQFLSHEALFPHSAASTDDGPQTAVRWGVFVRAVLELLRRRESPPDVVHLAGWQTGALAVLLAEGAPSIPTVFTIDDGRAHGLFERSHLGTFGIPESWWRLDGVEFFSKLSTLKAAIQAATRLTTPSPHYTRELLENAGGLEGALRTRGRALAGLLDGVDGSVWNSSTDPWLESRYDAMEVARRADTGKGRCKVALQREVGLPVRGDVPLVGAIGLLTAGSGFWSLVEIGTQLLRNDVQLVVLAEPGSDPALVHALHELRARFPDRLAVRADAETAVVHRGLAGSDLVLAADAHDPGGARAMQAQRYGALPIARRSGGAADAIVDCDAKLVSGTGFLHDQGTAESLFGALGRGLSGFADRDAFRATQHRAMTVDHSWDRAARLHERLYRSIRPAEPALGAAPTP